MRGTFLSPVYWCKVGNGDEGYRISHTWNNDGCGCKLNMLCQPMSVKICSADRKYVKNVLLQEKHMRWILHVVGEPLNEYICVYCIWSTKHGHNLRMWVYIRYQVVGTGLRGRMTGTKERCSVHQDIDIWTIFRHASHCTHASHSDWIHAGAAGVCLCAWERIYFWIYKGLGIDERDFIAVVLPMLHRNCTGTPKFSIYLASLYAV